MPLSSSPVLLPLSILLSFPTCLLDFSHFFLLIVPFHLFLFFSPLLSIPLPLFVLFSPPLFHLSIPSPKLFSAFLLNFFISFLPFFDSPFPHVSSHSYFLTLFLSFLPFLLIVLFFNFPSFSSYPFTPFPVSPTPPFSPFVFFTYPGTLPMYPMYNPQVHLVPLMPINTQTRVTDESVYVAPLIPTPVLMGMNSL